MAIAISIVSVMVACLSLTWTVWTWLSGRRTKLRLEILAGDVPDGTVWAIECVCINDSNHRVYIRGVYIELDRSDPLEIVHMFAGKNRIKTAELEPGQEVSFFFPGEEIATKYDLNGLAFVARTTRGQCAFRQILTWNTPPLSWLY
ncbi:hypothetical protein [Phytohabitans houttuyneae]|uniref:Uncharacterized protein n=1 Tax=Phytohabitans houttuyneae TaxID=1076126 RepID=A0A6V8KPN6_9ACTN|nr:hypothetical protein [Phytohabitans houttuyneae]GFJ82645.1 hypothetical protein Phou_068250 [Phytohabitans houttuyneae]